jgi:hypothetical protein
MAADAIITDSGAMHVAGVPIVNPSTVVVWEVTPGPGNGFQATPMASASNGVPPSVKPPNWSGFAPLAAYLFSWQEHLMSEAMPGKKHMDKDFTDTVSLHCSPVSNFSAYVSPEAAAQSAATTTWGSGVSAVAFDPTRGGSVIAVVIVEGTYQHSELKFYFLPVPYFSHKKSSFSMFLYSLCDYACATVSWALFLPLLELILIFLQRCEAKFHVRVS